MVNQHSYNLYLRWNEALQHVDALHNDAGLQHVHLELQRLHAETVELREGGGEELPQHLGLLGRALLQPALGTTSTSLIQIK